MGEKAGAIWYTTLTTKLNENSDFQEAPMSPCR